MMLKEVVCKTLLQFDELNWLREKLEKAEKSGFTKMNKKQIRKEAKVLKNGCL